MGQKNLFVHLAYWLKVVALGMMLGFGIQTVKAWVEPTQGPPFGNVFGPITTGNAYQTKDGAMAVTGVMDLKDPADSASYRRMYAPSLNPMEIQYRSFHPSITLVTLRDGSAGNRITGQIYGDAATGWFGLMGANEKWSYLSVKNNYTQLLIGGDDDPTHPPVPHLTLRRINDDRGSLRVGPLKDDNDATAGYGSQLYFSGGGDWGGWDSDNSDALWMGRYNSANDQSQLHINIGDNPGEARDGLEVGITPGGVGWTPLFTVRANGRVGIGTTSPGAKLHISDGNAVSSNLITSDHQIISTEGNVSPTLSIISDGAGQGERAVFKGVRARGTLNSPTVPLVDDNVVSLLGAIYDGTDTEGTAGIFLRVDGDVSNNVAPQRIEFVTSETTAIARTAKMTIEANGEVGIGTTDPGYKLDVNGGIRSYSGGGNNAGGVYIGNFQFYDSSSGFLRLGEASGVGVNNVLLETGHLRITNDAQFVYGVDSNPIAGVSGIWKSDGSVGIGTTSPNAKLFVDGGSYGTTNSSNQAAYALGASSIGADTSIYSYGSVCTGNQSGRCTGSGGVVMGEGNANATVNITAGTSFFNGGNVGIGTTDPGVYKLNVNGSINGTQLCINGTCRGSWPSGGVGGSGTANYVAKFTAGTALGNSQIYDDGSGVGIGTTNLESYKLNVNGSAKISGLDLNDYSLSNVYSLFVNNSITLTPLSNDTNAAVGTLNPTIRSYNTIGNGVGCAIGTMGQIRVKNDQDNSPTELCWCGKQVGGFGQTFYLWYCVAYN